VPAARPDGLGDQVQHESDQQPAGLDARGAVGDQPCCVHAHADDVADLLDHFVTRYA
jgi:hypothetical protein